jgi:hypothetical protein
MKLGYKSDEDLWRCPECNAIYIYVSEQAWTGSGNNDNDNLDRLSDENAATVCALIDGGDAPLDDAQLDALFALPYTARGLVFWNLWRRSHTMLRGAVPRMVASLARGGYHGDFHFTHGFLKNMVELSPEDARRVKDEIAKHQYKSPHPFDGLLSDIAARLR